MKKILTCIIAVLLGSSMYALRTKISPDGNDNLRIAMNMASAGDTIVLADGVYVESNQNYLAFDKDLVIMADQGASPIIQPRVYMTISDGAKAELRGIRIDASELTSLVDYYEHLIVAKDNNENNSLVMDNCEIYNFNINNSVIYCSTSNQLVSCVINGCYFHDITKSCMFFENDGMMELQITNSTFANIETNTNSYYAGMIDVKGSNTHVAIDHCTFYNCNVMNTDYGAIKVRTSTDAHVSNSIFAMPESFSTGRAIYTTSGTVSRCMTFNYAKDNMSGIHSGPEISDCVYADPMFMDATNGNFALAANSPARNVASDGSDLGDPRWYTTEELPSTDLYFPYILTGETAILDGDINLNNDKNIEFAGNMDNGTATWKININRPCTIKASINMSAYSTSGYQFMIDILDANNEIIGELTQPDASWNSTTTELPDSITILQAGDYRIRLSNLMQWSAAIVESVKLYSVGSNNYDNDSLIILWRGNEVLAWNEIAAQDATVGALLEEHDNLLITVSEKGQADWPKVLLRDIASISVGEDFLLNDIADFPYIVEFTLTADQVEALKSGFRVCGDGVTVTQLALQKHSAEENDSITDSQFIWTGNVAISWDTDICEGEQFDTYNYDPNLFTGLETGDIIEVGFTKESDIAQVVLTYKSGEDWEWIDMAALYPADENYANAVTLRYTVESDDIAQYIATRGIIVRGVCFTMTHISLPTAEETNPACTIASGTCGINEDNLTWVLDCDNVLTISGEGEMATYNSNTTPWYAYRSLIKRVVIEEGVTRLSPYAFYNSSDNTDYSALTHVVIPSTILTLSNNQFWQCQIDTVELNSESLMQSITSSSNNLMYMFGKQVRVYILGESVQTIGKYAFYNQGEDSLKTVVLPQGLTTISVWGFGYLENLQTMELPDAVTSIGGNAFSGCTNLRSMTIGSGVTEINSQAFRDCNSLTAVTCNALTPPTLAASDAFAIYDTLYVPCESVELYKQAQYWQSFSTILCADDSVGGNTETDALETITLTLDSSWQFVMLPTVFGLTLDDIVVDGGEIEWGTYSGEQRATGQSGWQAYNPANGFVGAQAYIVRARNDNATLTIHVPEQAREQGTTVIPFSYYPSAHEQNANWNFLGNPYPYSYDIMGAMVAAGIESPIAVWNGTGYITYTPGIDVKILDSFEAFFVQLPDSGAEILTFLPEYIQGYNGN